MSLINNIKIHSAKNIISVYSCSDFRITLKELISSADVNTIRHITPCSNCSILASFSYKKFNSSMLFDVFFKPSVELKIVHIKIPINIAEDLKFSHIWSWIILVSSYFSVILKFILYDLSL